MSLGTSKSLSVFLLISLILVWEGNLVNGTPTNQRNSIEKSKRAIEPPPPAPSGEPPLDRHKWEGYIENMMNTATEFGSRRQMLHCWKDKNSLSDHTKPDGKQPQPGVQHFSLYTLGRHLYQRYKDTTEEFISRRGKNISPEGQENTDSECPPVYCFAGGIIVSICNRRKNEIPVTIYKKEVGRMIYELAPHLLADRWWLSLGGNDRSSTGRVLERPCTAWSDPSKEPQHPGYIVSTGWGEDGWKVLVQQILDGGDKEGGVSGCKRWEELGIGSGTEAESISEDTPLEPPATRPPLLNYTERPHDLGTYGWPLCVALDFLRFGPFGWRYRKPNFWVARSIYSIDGI